MHQRVDPPRPRRAQHGDRAGGQPGGVEHARIDTILRALFDHYVEHPPPGVEGATVAERVTDRIAGMTDRFSIREFEALAVPRSFA